MSGQQAAVHARSNNPYAADVALPMTLDMLKPPKGPAPVTSYRTRRKRHNDLGRSGAADLLHAKPVSVH
jgi:hypothetical protein